jgi:hypothetical protein
VRMPWRASLRSTIAAARTCAAALVPFLSGCSEPSAPPGPPYIAIVSNLYALDGATKPARLTYRVRELSGVAGVDRRLSAAPEDTIILPVPPASYAITIEGLPSRCVVSNGPARGIAVSEADNTGLIRYNIQCRGLLNVAAIVDGYDRDQSFVFRMRDSLGNDHTGLVAANDTATLNDAPAGRFEVQLGGVAPNCVITSDGGAIQHVEVSPTGGATLMFRIQCSELARRPQLLSLVSDYVGGASVFTFRVWDPDGDLDGYTWDITDCRGNSVLPEQRERTRRGLRGGRGQLVDTLQVVGAYELGLAPAELEGRCTEVRVFDMRSNMSIIATHRIGSTTGFTPVVRFFNATLQGTAQVTSLLLGSDPENDIIGHFVLVRLRDGVLGVADGKPDLGSMDAAGYEGLDVAPIPTTGRIRWDDVLSVIVYVIDSKGNAVRIEDADIFK